MSSWKGLLSCLPLKLIASPFPWPYMSSPSPGVFESSFSQVFISCFTHGCAQPIWDITVESTDILEGGYASRTVSVPSPNADLIGVECIGFISSRVVWSLFRYCHMVAVLGCVLTIIDWTGCLKGKWGAGKYMSQTQTFRIVCVFPC